MIEYKVYDRRQKGEDVRIMAWIAEYAIENGMETICIIEGNTPDLVLVVCADEYMDKLGEWVGTKSDMSHRESINDRENVGGSIDAFDIFKKWFSGLS